MDYDDLEILTPRRKRALAWTAAAALVLVAAAAGLQAWGRARLDDLRRVHARHGPLDPAAYAPQVAPDEENAARAFLAAATGIAPLPQDELTLREARNRRPAAWPPDVLAAVERHLAANAEPLAGLQRAAALSGGGLDLDYTRIDPVGTSPPWDLVAAGRLLELTAHAAVARGDLEAAVAAAEVAGRLAGLLHAEPVLTFQILGLHAGGGQLRAVREILAAGPPPEMLPRLARSVAGPTERAGLARAVRREAATILGPEPSRLARNVARNAGPHWRAAAWIAGEHLLVEGWAGRFELARVDELPYPRLAEEVESARSPLPLGPFEGLHVDLQVAALRADAGAASRQLAALALVVATAGARDGAYPAALPDHPAATGRDPLTDSLPSYRVAADGSARLWLDSAEGKFGSRASLASLPFTWQLPAPRPAG